MSLGVYIVTGANRGIGKEICRQLAEKLSPSSNIILLTARDIKKAQEACKELGKPHIKEYQLDVASTDSIINFSKQIEKEYGFVDVLINNAGIMDNRSGKFTAQEVLETNFFGVLRMTEAFLPLVQKKNGRIINVSSSLGFIDSNYAPQIRERLLKPELTKIELVELLNSYLEDVNAGKTKGIWPNTAYNVSKAAVNMISRIMARDEKKCYY